MPGNELSVNPPTVVRGCYRVLVEAVDVAESLPASIMSGRLDRILVADALIRAGWSPPDAW